MHATGLAALEFAAGGPGQHPTTQDHDVQKIDFVCLCNGSAQIRLKLPQVLRRQLPAAFNEQEHVLPARVLDRTSHSALRSYLGGSREGRLFDVL
ncbi:MAG: hypothetical protein EOO70_07900 [Myxococcaceae bacterium]|nr:MAG: hypothetical protein EOO70_07900 [Myxococcaceae bacterium]